VVLKLRYSNFETITRSETREPATASADEIASRIVALLDRTEAGKRPVRLLGASLHGVRSPLTTFDDKSLNAQGLLES